MILIFAIEQGDVEEAVYKELALHSLLLLPKA
jgi:hypothetical protein